MNKRGEVSLHIFSEEMVNQTETARTFFISEFHNLCKNFHAKTESSCSIDSSFYMSTEIICLKIAFPRIKNKFPQLSFSNIKQFNLSFIMQADVLT